MTLEERMAANREQVAAKKAELKTKATEARAAGDMADMQACVDACKALQADIEQLNADYQTMATACGMDTQEDPTDPNAQQNDNNPEDMPVDPTLDETNDRDNKKDGVIRSMKRINTNTNANENEEVRNALNAFLHSKGEKRDGLTSVGVAEVIVPNQLLKLQAQPTNIVNLGSLVNKVSVTSPAGSLPIFSRARAGFVTKAELAANPQATNPALSQVDYTLDTLSAFLTLSQEAIDDTAIDLTSFITNYISESKDEAEEKLIGAVLKTAAAVSVSNLDGLKDVVNLQIPIGYDKKVILTQSAYGDLDKVKDANGRYLLQDSIASASGKILFGLPVVVVNDDVLGVAGDKVAFIGDPKSFVTEAYKTDISIKFIDSYVYGVQIGAYFRTNVVKADAEAGKFVTLAFV